jgi:hypothetical protein
MTDIAWIHGSMPARRTAAYAKGSRRCRPALPKMRIVANVIAGHGAKSVIKAIMGVEAGQRSRSRRTSIGRQKTTVQRARLARE